jgi:uncharacterized MAPEG superfamily protein
MVSKMTIDLACLLFLGLWTIPLSHIPAIARAKYASVEWVMGNRDTLPKVPAWVDRADRAQRNHLENLPMFAIVILIASLLGKTNAITAVASIVIVVFRVSHSVIYMLGIPKIRSMLYFGALFGLLAIVFQMFG